jgi:hypothetical protein
MTRQARPGFQRAAAALIALAVALSAPAGPAAASNGAQLMNVCAPPEGRPTPACYAYLQAIIDDANLVGADVDRRFVEGFGLFCAPPDAQMDAVAAAVVRTIRADPSLRQHSAAMAVRLAMPRLYPCTREMLRRPPPPKH